MHPCPPLLQLLSHSTKSHLLTQRRPITWKKVLCRTGLGLLHSSPSVCRRDPACGRTGTPREPAVHFHDAVPLGVWVQGPFSLTSHALSLLGPQSPYLQDGVFAEPALVLSAASVSSCPPHTSTQLTFPEGLGLSPCCMPTAQSPGAPPLMLGCLCRSAVAPRPWS